MIIHLGVCSFKRNVLHLGLLNLVLLGPRRRLVAEMLLHVEIHLNVGSELSLRGEISPHCVHTLYMYIYIIIYKYKYMIYMLYDLMMLSIIITKHLFYNHNNNYYNYQTAMYYNIYIIIYTSLVS